MIEIQNYAPFIQLAVAFDFACVTFNSKKEKIQNQIDNLSGLAKDLIKKHQAKISEDIKREILNPSLASYENKLTNKLKERQKRINHKLTTLENMDAHFLGPVSLVSGIYCTIVLLLIGEIDQSTYLVRTYTFFTEFTFIILLGFIIGEIRANIKHVKNPDFQIYKYTYLLTLFASICSISASLIMSISKFNLNFLFFRDIQFIDISHYSLIIPFISFLGVLLWLISFTLSTVFLVILSIVTRWHYHIQIKWFRTKQVLSILLKYIKETSKYKEIKIVEKTSSLDGIFEKSASSPSIEEESQHEVFNKTNPTQAPQKLIVSKNKTPRKRKT